MVRKYETTRPGFMLMSADGKKRGSVGLSAVSAKKSLDRALDYLARARRSKTPLPNQHERITLTMGELTAMKGQYIAFSVTRGGVADKLGIRERDRLISIGGIPVTGFGGISAALAKHGGKVVTWKIGRAAGLPIEVKHKGSIPGVKWAFSTRRVKLPGRR